MNNSTDDAQLGTHSKSDNRTHIPPYAPSSLPRLKSSSLKIATEEFAEFWGIPEQKIIDAFGRKRHLTPELASKWLADEPHKLVTQIISFQMLKGGVAKTTSALNIGLRASQYGLRVLFIDLDQQANLSFSLGFEDPDARVWVDVVEGHADAESLIIPISQQIDLIPSNLNNSVMERALLSGRKNIARAIAQPLKQIRDQYDLILIDTAPSLSATNTAATCASDVVLLPVYPDQYSMVGLQKTLHEIDSIQEEFLEEKNIQKRILFTRFDARETSSREFLKICSERLGDYMMESFVRTSTEVKNIIGTGKTIFDQKGIAKEDYDLVTQEVLGWARRSRREGNTLSGLTQNKEKGAPSNAESI